jgi:comEA protein
MAKDWTSGAAKWAAVFCLGGFSAMGVAWSLWGGGAHAVEVRERAIPVVAPAPPAPTAMVLPAAPDVSAPAAQPQAGEFPPAPVAQEATLAAPRAETQSLTRTININTASAAELELLPGIGPAMAARIIEHRTSIGRFRTVDELDDVRGIGPKTLAKLRPLVRVE